MAERNDTRYHAALASSTRRLVLDALTRSPVALDAQALSTALGLHVTTVRFHLDHLEEAHLIRHEPDPLGGRGRPRMLYSALEHAEDSREQLIDVLAGALAARENDDGQARSIDAGRQWANALAADDHAPEVGSSLLNVLDELGFDPRPTGNNVIRLEACPFRQAARSHPEVVCSVHRGLIERVLETDDAMTADSARLLPFVEPDLCLIELHHAV